MILIVCCVMIVPMNQMNMFLEECTTQEYIENTLDPIATRSLFRNDQYFYYLCMMQRYTRQSCPTYLTREGFDILKVRNKEIGRWVILQY